MLKLGACCAVAVALLSVPASTAGPSTRTITEWAIPGCVNVEEPGPPPFIIPGCEPLHVTMLSDRWIFFTERQAHKVGRLDVHTNVLTEWTLPNVPNPNSPAALPLRPFPHLIVADGDDVLFAETGTNRIGKLDPTTGVLTEWALPFFPFVNQAGNTILVSRSPLHPVKAGRLVYVSLNRSNEIARLDTQTGVLTRWALPTAAAAINGVAVQGNLVFFAEVAGNRIGRLDPDTNTITEWELPNADSAPQHVRISGRRVFFVESAGGRIGRLDLDSDSLTEWTIPTLPSNPTDLELHGPQRVAFTEFDGNQVGELKVADEAGVETVVAPLATVVAPAVDTLAVSTTLPASASTTLAPTVTEVAGVETGGFTEWAVPTPGSGLVGLTRYRGNGGAFCESVANKVGIVR
jgi:virginiamycin B lyase